MARRNGTILRIEPATPNSLVAIKWLWSTVFRELEGVAVEDGDDRAGDASGKD
jgi:hypothetical protein